MDESFKEKFEIKVIGETSVSPPEELLVRFCSSRLKLRSSGLKIQGEVQNQGDRKFLWVILDT